MRRRPPPRAPDAAPAGPTPSEPASASGAIQKFRLRRCDDVSAARAARRRISAIVRPLSTWEWSSWFDIASAASSASSDRPSAARRAFSSSIWGAASSPCAARSSNQVGTFFDESSWLSSWWYSSFQLREAGARGAQALADARDRQAGLARDLFQCHPVDEVHDRDGLRARCQRVIGAKELGQEIARQRSSRKAANDIRTWRIMSRSTPTQPFLAGERRSAHAAPSAGMYSLCKVCRRIR